MGDYKKSREHLTNAALASPLAFMAGGPVGAAMVLGLGKMIDHLEDKDFERKQQEWKNNPNRPIDLTPQQMSDKLRKSLEAANKINNLPHFEDAIKIMGKSRNGEYVTTSGGNRLFYTQTGIGKGEVIFHKDGYDWAGYKKMPATLYYYAQDFFDRFKNDYKTYPNMKIYKIIGATATEGRWMYTADNGNTFVVGL